MAQQFQVDLRAVVDLLARHVYSSPRVFVRELLQNALDAVTARRLEDPTAPLEPIRIRPADAGGNGALLVEDCGIGLNEAGVRSLVATIGASSKRGENGGPSDVFLGKFGIGILSCFVVAEHIELLSRSASGDEPVRFLGSSDGTYELRPLEPTDSGRGDVGTTVRLVARPGEQRWLRFETVVGLARDFGSALPIPVLVERPDGTWVDVVDPSPAWLGASTAAELPQRRTAQVKWCEDNFGFRPLDVIAVSAEQYGAEGLAFVLPFEGNASTNPGHRIYMKRMLLSEQERRVMPYWAFFTRAVIDVGSLQPTASRESLVEDADLSAAADALGRSVRTWLLRLGVTGGEKLERFLAIHGRAAKALASHDDQVLDALLPFLLFETTEGLLAVDEIVARSGTVRFATTIDRFRQLAPIAVAQGLLLVNGGHSYDMDVLLRVPALRAKVEAAPIGDDEIVATLDSLPEDRQVWATRFLELAREALAQVACGVELRDFAPDALPALHLHGDAARQVGDTADAGGFDEEWARLLAALGMGERAGPRLVCNDRHPLVRRLVDASMEGEPLVASVVQALYVQALLLGHHPVRGADLALLNDALLDVVDAALDR